MKFDIEREGSYSFDFVKDNMDNILACIARRDEKFELNYNERKRFYQNLFNSNGLMTGNVKPIGGDIRTRREIRKKGTYWQYELSDFWEGFAEFILQKDFIFLQTEVVWETLCDLMKKIGLEIYFLYEEIDKFYSDCSYKTCNILLDILKRKYEFENRPSEYIKSCTPVAPIEVIEKNGVKYYRLTFSEITFYIPKDEIDQTEVVIKLNRYIKTMRFQRFFRRLERLLLTPDEQNEYTKRCSAIEEYREAKIKEIKNTPGYIKARKQYMEAKIKAAEKIVNSYKVVFTKNDVIRTSEESQLLRDCLVDESIFALDSFGITKPTASFSFPKTFYFIEVKSISKKFGTVYLSPRQKRFIEEAKGKLDILILHIKVEPHEVTVRYLLPQ
ncbi:MAG: hypothetical protein U9N41_02405 [Euryarchaeota archaeon]|nr:hypothetical protein [Euryarchaeota archaeon]